MKRLLYKGIIFDDWGTDSDSHRWTEICPQCIKKYQGVITNELDDSHSALGVCSVLGCNNSADCYFDCNDEFVSLEE